MQMWSRFLLALAVGLIANAQVTTSSPVEVRRVAVAPSGSCAQSSAIRLSTPAGDLYSCKNGTWGLISGSGSSDAASIGAAIKCADTGSANALVCAPSPAVGSYAAGLVLAVKVANDNSGSTTINVSGLGTKAVTKAGSTALIGGELKAGDQVILTYDGTRFQMQVGLPACVEGVSGITCSKALTIGATVTGGCTERGGTGSPESVVTGSVCDTYRRTDGGSGTTLYVKESGSATNTGWIGYGNLNTGYTSLTDASPISWNVASSIVSNKTITLDHTIATRALNMSNMVAGGNYFVRIAQDATGNVPMTRGTGCTWIGASGTFTGTAFNINLAPSSITDLFIHYDGTYCHATATPMYS